MKLHGQFTAAQMAQVLDDAGRAMTQVLPPIASDEFSSRYRRMCEMLLYGCAAMPRKRTPTKKVAPKRKMSKRR